MTSTTHRRQARTLWLLFAGIVTFLIAVFAVFEWAGPDQLAAPETWQTEASLMVATWSFLVLASDVLLPIPSSLIMGANGALFGFGAGAAISAAGLFTSSWLAYALGRWWAPRFRRRFEAAASLEAMLDRRGVLALVATRPLPILAEATAFMAGAGPLPTGRFLIAAAAGSAITGTAYAAAGATLVANGTWVALGVTTGLVAALWLIDRTIRTRL